MLIKHLKATAYEAILYNVAPDSFVDLLRRDNKVLDISYIKEKIGSKKRLTMVVYLEPSVEFKEREDYIRKLIGNTILVQNRKPLPH